MEGKNIQVVVDGIPKFNIYVTEDTKIGEIKKILSRIDYKTIEMEVYPGKKLPKVFETKTYDKTNLKSVYNKLRDAKIYLTTKTKKSKKEIKTASIPQIEHGFPTGNKDVDVLFLSRFDDKTLLNALNINKETKKYADNEDLWRNRFLQRHPEDFETVSNLLRKYQTSWKDFSLSLIKYLDLAKGNYNEAMELAAKGGHRDLVDFFIKKGADDWHVAMAAAAEGGHRDLVVFFISKGVDSWNSALQSAAKGGNRDLVDFFISKGANYWNWAIYGAARGGHRDLVNFFISKGANDWDAAMRGAAEGGHRDLVDFFLKKGAKDWQSAVEGAVKGNHLDLVKYFAAKSKKIDWDDVMIEATISGHKDIIKYAISKGAEEWNRAMYIATGTNRIDLVKFFISKGAYDFERGLEIAKEEDNSELVEFFQNKIRG